MKKNFIKIICMGVVMIMCAGIMCACNNNDDDYRNPRNGEPEAGEFYTLQEAYDNGWLSKGDLRNIAYYYAGDGQRKGFKPTPKNPETLSAETELAIKEAFAAELRESSNISDADADGVIISGYYGVYEGMISVYIDTIYWAYPDVIMEPIMIGGVRFGYYCQTNIKFWKIKNI